MKVELVKCFQLDRKYLWVTSLCCSAAAPPAALQHLTAVLKIYSLLICWDKVIVLVVVVVAVAVVALIVSCIFGCMLSNFICSLCIRLMESLYWATCIGYAHVLGLSICVRQLPQSKLLLNVHKEVFIVYSFRGLVTNSPLCSGSSENARHLCLHSVA